MAIQVINDPYRSLSASLGAGLGSGLGQGLQYLAQTKLNQIAERSQNLKKAQALKAAGLPEEAISLFIQYPDLIKDYLQRGGALVGQSQQQAPDQQAMMAQQYNEPQAIEQALALLQQQPQGPQTFHDLMGNLTRQSPSLQNALSALAPFQQQQELPQAQGMMTQVSQPSQQQQRVPQQEIKRPASVAEVLARPSPEERRRERALEIQEEKLKSQQSQFERKLGAREQEISDKETLPVYQEIVKSGKAARETNRDLNKMEQLVAKGKLTNPSFNAFLDTLGRGIFGLSIDLKNLTNPDSEEFEKISNSFIKHAKDVFGSRITDNDLKAFLKTIPTLSQSNEGKLRIIQNMREFNEGSLLREQTMRDIIKQNNGKRPRDLDIIIEERVAPQLDQLSTRFKREFKNVPQPKSFLGDLLGGSIDKLLLNK